MWGSPPPQGVSLSLWALSRNLCEKTLIPHGGHQSPHFPACSLLLHLLANLFFDQGSIATSSRRPSLLPATTAPFGQLLFPLLSLIHLHKGSSFRTGAVPGPSPKQGSWAEFSACLWDHVLHHLLWKALPDAHCSRVGCSASEPSWHRVPRSGASFPSCLLG